MPEFIRKNIDEDTLLAIWQITEGSDELRSVISLDEEEESMYRSFVAESRKRQWLAYRLLIRELVKPEEIKLIYEASGKPVITGGHMHLSVSHSDDLATVIISRKANVGIDIEKVKPRITKVTDKFLSRPEMDAISTENELEQLTLAWCAKEALYKLYGQRNLDFREHIRLDIPAQAGNDFHGEIISGSRRKKYRLSSVKTLNSILVYCIDRPI
jgi:phosphopantetheinyl transferase